MELIHEYTVWIKLHLCFIKTWQSAGTALHTLSLKIRLRWVVSCAKMLHTPNMQPLNLPDRILGSLQSQSIHSGIQTKPLALLGIKPQSFNSQPSHYADWNIFSVSTARAQLFHSYCSVKLTETGIMTITTYLSDATNLSTAVQLLSVTLAESCAERQLGWPMYVQVGPQFLPECIL